jgi:hypothetical protein
MKKENAPLNTLNVATAKRAIVVAILCIGGLGSASLPSALSSAQSAGLDSIFVVSQRITSEELSSTIWEIDISTGSAAALYTRPAATEELAPATLSQNELAYFDAELAAGLIFPDSWRDTHPMEHFILKVWQLDETHLLLLSSKALCYYRSNGPCFGYYEFEILDLEHPETTRSLWKLDYHPSQQEQWWGCRVGPTQKTMISGLQLPPTEDRFAFTLEPEGNCGSIAHHSHGHAFLLDFSGAQANVVDVGTGSVSAWSPDGTQLLVFGMADPQCDTGGCETFSRVYDFSTGAPVLTHEVDYLTSRLVTQPVWLSDSQIIYQGIVHISFDDIPNVLFLVDLPTGEQTEVARQAFQDLYRLSPDASYFIGMRSKWYSDPDEVVLFSLEGNEYTPLNDFTAWYLTDENNLSDYFLLYQGYYQVLAIGPDLTPIPLDLDTLVPLPENIGSGGIVSFSPSIQREAPPPITRDTSVATPRSASRKPMASSSASTALP